MTGKTAEVKDKKETKPKNEAKIAVVRVRGKINLNHDLKKTFEMLNLYNKNGCVVLKDTPSVRGMIKKVKDYVTWGEITDDVYKELMTKADEYKARAEDKSGNKYNYLEFNKKKYKKWSIYGC